MLRVTKTIAVGVLEVSGMGWRWVQGRRQLLVIGDQTCHLAVAPWEDELTFSLHDLQALLPAGEQEDSQWEAVAGDASGAIFVLQENPGAVGNAYLLEVPSKP